MKVNFEKIIIPSSIENIRNLLTKFIQSKICMNLLNDPHDCLCCNQTFCKSCIINYIKANKKCPFSEFFENKNSTNKDVNDLMKKIKPSSSNFSKVIQSLKFFCQYKEKGCNEELNIEEILEHEKLCKFSNKISKNNSNTKKDKNKEKIINENINSKLDDIEEVNYRKNSFEKNQKDIIQKKERKSSDIIYRNSFRKNTISSNSNQLKQQDSIISFCDIKNLLDEKNTRKNSLNDIENFKNDLNGALKKLNIEKYMDEINQKLSILNKYIINSNELRLNNEYYYKLSNYNQNVEKDVSEFNIKFDNENKKEIKNKSIPISNNNFEDSFTNSINNFSEQQTNKVDYFETIKNETKKPQKNNIISLNLKSNKTIEISNKKNKVQKYLKHTKNVKHQILNKNSNKKIKTKDLKIFSEFNSTINNSKILNQTKTENILGRNPIHFTPKLGSKSKKNVKEDKSFKMSTEINNSIYFQNEYHSLIEDILISIKNLDNKVNTIEKILQSNSCFTNQEYSIQNDYTNDKVKYNSNNKENLFDEKILQSINNLVDKKEENLKNILNEKMESFKKYITEQCISEMKKSILDTNIDIMALYHDKLEEFEKIINKNYSKNEKDSK